FSTTTKVSGPNLVGKPSASTVAPYSMQPSSACTAGTLARNASSTASRCPGWAVMIATTWSMAVVSSVHDDRSVPPPPPFAKTCYGWQRDRGGGHERNRSHRNAPGRRRPCAGRDRLLRHQGRGGQA